MKYPSRHPIFDAVEAEGWKEYQPEGVQFLIKYMRCILGDEMGLGKTIQCLAALVWLGFHEERVLVVAGKAAQHVWLTHVLRWIPSMSITIICGSPAKRRKMWEDLEPGITMCTWGVLIRDIEMIPKEGWACIIADECHQAHNRKTKNFKALKRLRSASEYLWLVSGTPVRKGPQTLWALLNLINWKTYTSYWKFVTAFCHVEKGFWGFEILGPRNLPQLRKLLKPIMIRRRKKDLGHNIKTRGRIEVDIEGPQKKVYNDLVTNMIAFVPDSEDMIISPTQMVTIMRLRQLLVIPKILSEDLPDGAGLDAIIDHLQDAGDRPRAVIFTPFAKAIPYIEIRLNKEGYINPVILKGGLSVEELAQCLKSFAERECIAICTIKFAQSFDMDVAPTAYFLGYEWDPFDNEQAEDRLDRMTTKHMVNIHYIVHRGTNDETMLDVLDTKARNVNAVLYRKSLNYV